MASPIDKKQGRSRNDWGENETSRERVDRAQWSIPNILRAFS
jgi:hypothetical protein